MKLRNKLIVLLMLLSGSVVNAAGYETQLLKAKLDAYDKSNNSVVINGRPYAVKIDATKSAYDDELNALKLVKTSDLRTGGTYFFTLYAGQAEIRKGTQLVVFISVEEPEQ